MEEFFFNDFHQILSVAAGEVGPAAKDIDTQEHSMVEEYTPISGIELIADPAKIEDTKRVQDADEFSVLDALA
ncbi:hypothetical protein INT45_014033 [Circinella minor]|uniref:Uncharacterized protein n=1 Tax=Circinella minor TaxID=1195481 RepID=A0A8H7VNP3_9FUNG|nr:hypothetical protein INT45_014033 [Circinella minor]